MRRIQGSWSLLSALLVTVILGEHCAQKLIDRLGGWTIVLIFKVESYDDLISVDDVQIFWRAQLKVNAVLKVPVMKLVGFLRALKGYFDAVFGSLDTCEHSDDLWVFFVFSVVQPAQTVIGAATPATASFAFRVKTPFIADVFWG
jgi:hypothetical protein